MNIFIKGTYLPIGHVEIRVHNHTPKTINFNGNAISFSAESGNISAIKKIEISPEELDYVKDTEKTLPYNEQFEENLTNQYEDIRTIVKYIQAFDAVFNLDDDLSMKCFYEWSLDFVSWAPIPEKRKTSWKAFELRVVLPGNLLGQIERLANKGIPVFSAFKHLYKAYGEPDPRFKWINGTIAAEHAFKEFLSLKDSRVESLMLHVPSPPVEKLYKNVLFAYTGQESSMYKQLQKGASKRNELIHRPATKSPNLKETDIYLHQVEVAIFELYTFLYPKDSFFEYSLKRAKESILLGNPILSLS
ncbi:MAG TPA: hypothetical protein PLS00_00070 [Niabella sp.]|nr:hypothetical protein [Niabella sp.]HUN01219.1 hypothetical protein [Niabella sp.]